jgi:hypothetical protein
MMGEIQPPTPGSLFLFLKDPPVLRRFYAFDEPFHSLQIIDFRCRFVGP